MVRSLRQLVRMIPRRAIQWIVLATLSFMVAIGIHGLPVAAQSRAITQATITEILQGNQVYIQNRLAQVRDLARSGEQVRTGQARISLRFNTGAVGRLGANTVLTVGSQCLQLQQGQILVNGVANGCTRNHVAGVRGTMYLLEVDEQQQEHFTVLEGQVSLTQRDRPTAQPVLLDSGRRVIISDRGIVGQVQSLSRSEFDQILTSNVFQDFRDPLPGINALRQSYQQLYPGTVFPLGDDGANGLQWWNSTVRLSRTTSQGQSAIALQLTIHNKPRTTYANAVYQMYARKGNGWIPVYSNLGARLLSNAPGLVTVPPEIVPLKALRLEQLGFNPQTVILRGVVLLRYDLPNGERDQKLALETVVPGLDL